MNPIKNDFDINSILINGNKEIDPFFPNLQKADPYEALMEELIRKGVCEDEFGSVTPEWSSHSLPPLFLEEAAPLFQELFKERETLLKEGKSLLVNMGVVVGSFTKWMLSYDQNPHFLCRLHGDFLPYLFFKCLPKYSSRVFQCLGISHFKQETFTSCISFSKSTSVEIELEENAEGELHLKDVLNVALLCLKRHIQLNNEAIGKKITKKIVRKEVMNTGIYFADKTECSSSVNSLDDKGFVYLKINEKGPSFNWFITHGLSKRSTFSVNALCLPLQETLGILAPSYWVNGWCRPFSLCCSSLQSFLDQFFGFIRGEGEWFEFMALMTSGYTSVQKPTHESYLFREHELFAKYYDKLERDPFKLVESIQKDLNLFYPNRIDFHLLFLLNVAFYLDEKELHKESHFLLTSFFKETEQLEEQDPLIESLKFLLVGEDPIPLRLLGAFFQIFGCIKSFKSRIKCEEGSRELMVLGIGQQTLQIPYDLHEAVKNFLDAFHGDQCNGGQHENRLLQLFLLLYSEDTGEIEPEKMELPIELFVNSSSYLLNIIGLSAHIALNRSPFLVDIERILFGLTLHGASFEERIPLQNFLIQTITLGITELGLFSPPEFRVHNHQYIFKNEKVLTKEEKIILQKILTLISRHILDLKELSPLLWIPVFNSAGSDQRSLEMYSLWRNYVSHYVADSPIAPLILNMLLISLKKSASLGDKKASEAIDVLAHEYLKNMPLDPRSLDTSISALFLFATEYFLQKKIDEKKIVFLAKIVAPLLNILREAILAVKKNEGINVGCSKSSSHYKACHGYITNEYLQIVMRLKDPREFIQKAGISHFALYPTLKGELINLFCKKELIQDLNCLLKVSHKVMFFNSVENISDGALYFIPGINYEKVIPFLSRYLTLENLEGTLHLWRQSAVLAYEKKMGTKKSHQNIVRQANDLFNRAIQLDVEKKYQPLITRGLIDILFIPNWSAVLPEAKKYCALMLTYFLQLEDVELGGIGVNMVGHVLNEMLNWAKQNSLGGLEETFQVLPKAIMHVLRFNQSQFEQHAKAYWALKSYTGTAFIEAYNEKKIIGLMQLPVMGISRTIFDQKKEFLLMLIDEIPLVDQPSQRFLYKLSREFYLILKNELANARDLAEKKQGEMAQLVDRLKKAFNVVNSKEK